MLHDSKSVSLEALDLETGIPTIFSSMSEAARFFGVTPAIINRYFYRNTKKAYRGRYVLKKLSS
jgi:hypothetical protein